MLNWIGNILYMVYISRFWNKLPSKEDCTHPLHWAQSLKDCLWRSDALVLRVTSWHMICTWWRKPWWMSTFDVEIQLYNIIYISGTRVVNPSKGFPRKPWKINIPVYIYIWVNYNDLTVLPHWKSWLVRGIIPFYGPTIQFSELL